MREGKCQVLYYLMRGSEGPDGEGTHEGAESGARVKRVLLPSKL